MKIERTLGTEKIAQRLADEIARKHPQSRHIFPDTSFLLFGPNDFGGMEIKSTRQID